jgi:hypothetical protein
MRYYHSGRIQGSITPSPQCFLEIREKTNRFEDLAPVPRKSFFYSLPPAMGRLVAQRQHGEILAPSLFAHPQLICSSACHFEYHISSSSPVISQGFVARRWRRLLWHDLFKAGVTRQDLRTTAWRVTSRSKVEKSLARVALSAVVVEDR